jgi:hypothetical protein
MTTDHVYYHDLFKRGNSELLKHIKRKNSETTSNMGSMFELSNNYGLTTEEINHENSLLRRLNQKAFAQISCLEAKVESHLQENELLYRKINEKEKNEQLIETAFSKYFSEGKGDKSVLSLKDIKDSTSENENNDHSHQKTLTTEKSETESPAMSYNSTHSIDSMSNIDSYIGMDSHENIDNKQLPNTSTKNSLTYLSYSDLNQLSNDEEAQSIYKKKVVEITHSNDNPCLLEAKTKRISYQTTSQEEEQLVTNFMEFDFSGFLELLEERF